MTTRIEPDPITAQRKLNLIPSRFKLTRVQLSFAVGANGNDWALLGSRDAMLDGLFRGLQFLVELGPNARNLRRMFVVWHLLEARLRERLAAEGKPPLTSSHACHVAIGDYTLVRAVGRPQSLYHIFGDYGDAEACVARHRNGTSPVSSLSLCAVALAAGRYQLPMEALSRASGLTYDWPAAVSLPGTCGLAPPPGGCAQVHWSGASMSFDRSSSFANREVGDERQREWERTQEIVKRDGF